MGLFIDRIKKQEEFRPMADDDMIICRCEEITKGEIRKAIYAGMYTMNDIKRFLRPGMGLCQGLTCGPNVKAILAKELNVKITDLDDCTPRSPVRVVTLEDFGNEIED